MNDEERSRLLERAEAFQEREHQKNRIRIRNGFLSMLIVPGAFLILLFLMDYTGTSKLLMLVVWIAIMFLIGVYLIVIEFMDYKLMHMMDEPEPDSEEFTDEQEDGV